MAIGPVVYADQCRVIFNEEHRCLTLEFKQVCISYTSRRTETRFLPIRLTNSSIISVKAFAASSELESISNTAEGWIVLRIRKNHQLATYRAYDPESDDNKKKSVVLEFPKYVDRMTMTENLTSVLGACKVDILTCHKLMKACSESLIRHTAKQKRRADTLAGTKAKGLRVQKERVQAGKNEECAIELSSSDASDDND